MKWTLWYHFTRMEFRAGKESSVLQIHDLISFDRRYKQRVEVRSSTKVGKSLWTELLQQLKSSYFVRVLATFSLGPSASADLYLGTSTAQGGRRRAQR